MTKIEKSKYHGWSAKDVFPMGPASGGGRTGERELTITTGKGPRGGLRTSAYCTIRADGCTIMALGSDYSKTVAQVPGKCTEKAVRDLHATVMEQQKDAILIEAKAFYANKEQAEDINQRRDRELAEQDAKDSTCSDCGARVPEIVGCPDGAEVCRECFDQGAH